MEDSILYDRRFVSKLTKLLFKITFCFLMLMVILPFILEVNHTVSFKDATVYSKTPKTKILAPTEVAIEEIRVKEGQKVSRGDTLIVLRSEKIKRQFQISQIEKTSIENQILGLKHQLVLAKAKKESYKNLGFIKSISKSDQKRFLKEAVKNHNFKRKLSKQQQELAYNKFRADSILYEKGIISKIDYEKQKDKLLQAVTNELETELSYNKKKFEFKNSIYSENTLENKSITDLLNIEEQIANYEFELKGLASKLNNSKQDLNYHLNKKGNLIILAPVSGTISFLFNAQYNVNILPQESPLLTITPNSEAYYVKANLPEKDLMYVSENQEVILKANAYSYLKYGGLKGRINYVSTSAIRKDFYCIIDIKDYNPNIILKQDYKITGAIIVGQLKLYEYLFKIIFDKF